MDVLAVDEGGLAADQVLETNNDLTPVVEDSMGNYSDVNG